MGIVYVGKWDYAVARDERVARRPSPPPEPSAKIPMPPHASSGARSGARGGRGCGERRAGETNDSRAGSGEVRHEMRAQGRRAHRFGAFGIAASELAMTQSPRGSVVAAAARKPLPFYTCRGLAREKTEIPIYAISNKEPERKRRSAKAKQQARRICSNKKTANGPTERCYA